GIGAAPVFPNPKTGQLWEDVRRSFRKAVRTAGLHGLWVHDLRQSFITRAEGGHPGVGCDAHVGTQDPRGLRPRHVVDESDLRSAAGTLHQLGRVLDTVAEDAPEKRQSPTD